LADTYSDATGETLHALGLRASGNAKLFKRLALGLGCTLENAERASRWFADNWPDGVPWPDDVPRSGCCGNTPSEGVAA
jgi:hypothetical protein